MTTTNNMDLLDGFFPAGLHLGRDLFQAHQVASRLSTLSAEGAESTLIDTDVGVVQVLVVDVESPVSVEALPDQVGQITKKG